MRIALLLGCLLAAFACLADRGREGLMWDIGPRTWTLVSHPESSRVQSVHVFVPSGQNVEDWSERVTILNYTPPWGGATPRAASDTLRAALASECTGTGQWQVLRETPNAVIYEWLAAQCAGWPAQHELGTVLFGTLNRFVVRYTVKSAQMSDAQREEWIERLAGAWVSGAM